MPIPCEPTAEELAAYLGLKPEEIAQIVLLLLVRQGVQQKLSALVAYGDRMPQKSTS
jgi:hypothetical protein